MHFTKERLNITTDPIWSVKRALECRLPENKRMRRNFLKHVNRCKRTKFAQSYLLNNRNLGFKHPTLPSFSDFMKFGFVIPHLYYGETEYAMAALAASIIELKREQGPENNLLLTEPHRRALAFLDQLRAA